MLIYNADVFNEVITGTSTTWFSYAPFNATLGSSDLASVFAYTTNVTGTGTQLNIFGDVSNDGRVWFISQSAFFPGTNLTNGLVQQAFLSQFSFSFMRLRFTLSGLSTAQCQLKLTVTGRSFNGIGQV